MKRLLGFIAFSLFAAWLLISTGIHSYSSGPGPIPFLPTFGSGPPGATTPTNQPYSNSSAANATYFYQASAATWRQISAGTGGGTVTVTGSPVAGNLTEFSAATSITNGNLTGDVTTSGTLGTTLATTAVTAGSYGDASHYTTFTVDAKGRLTAAAQVSVPAGVTWPATASIVISNGTNSPPGLAESDGKVAVGVSGSWTAGNVPSTAGGSPDLYSPPNPAAYTSFSGDATTPTFTGTTYGTVMDSGATVNALVLRGFLKSTPATPWNFITRLNITIPATKVIFGGICISDGTKFELIGYQAQGVGTSSTTNPEDLDIAQWNSDVAFNTNTFISATARNPYLEISDDGTQIRFLTSFDGRNFQQQFTEAVGSYMTPTKLGFCVLPDNNGYAFGGGDVYVTALYSSLG